MRDRLRALLPSLALAAFSLLVAVACAELAVRIVRPQPLVDATPGLYEEDPPRRYRLRPGHEGKVSNLVEFDTRVAVDARGLRSVDEAEPLATDETLDVLAIGDSFTFGWGVEADETFVERLEAPLAEALGRPVEAWNAGVPGYGVVDEVDWLEAHGLALEPDVVLVAVFLGNDLLDATAAHREVEMVGGLVSQDGGGSGIRRWMDRHLHLVRLAKRALPPSLLATLRGAVGIDEEPWEIAYLRDTIGTYAEPRPPLVEEGLAATSAALERLRALADRHGFRVALVLLPDVRQVDAARWDAALRLLGAEDEAVDYDPLRPVRTFERLGAAIDAPVLDLVPAFRTAHAAIATDAATDDGRLYFRYDPHWTVAGHRLAAREIVPFLESSLAATAGSLDRSSTDGLETDRQEDT